MHSPFPENRHAYLIMACNNWRQLGMLLELLEAASRKEAYHYYHLLSGMCLPLKTQDEIQKLIGIDRLNGSDIVPAPGWTWFSITDDFCRYLTRNRPLITKLFRHTIASDEHFVGTMAVNSGFLDRIYDINDTAKNDYREGCMRLIDWERGKPYTWGTDDTEQDCETLMNSKYLFARKFDERVNFDLIQRIYSDLLKRQTVGETNNDE